MFFKVQFSTALGYGHRIWIPLASLNWDVQQKLNSLSKWGGHDKTYEDEMSWEFGGEQLTQAVAYLVEFGRMKYGEG